MFENVNLNDFWQESEYAYKEYVSEPVSEELIYEIEKELGYKLPAFYIYLMKKQNGGIPKRYCCPINTSTSWSDNHIQINGILFDVASVDERRSRRRLYRNCKICL